MDLITVVRTQMLARKGACIRVDLITVVRTEERKSDERRGYKLAVFI